MTQPFTAPVLPAALTPLRAIQTAYRGYNFRSRLEARWAVFFDALGLSWEYEPEGFEFEGERYLPDFYVKEWSCYVEVKHGDARLTRAITAARSARFEFGESGATL